MKVNPNILLSSKYAYIRNILHNLSAILVNNSISGEIHNKSVKFNILIQKSPLRDIKYMLGP